MDLNDRQSKLVVEGMRLKLDQLRTEAADDTLPELVIKVLNENITTLEEIIELIETDQFFLTLEEC